MPQPCSDLEQIRDRAFRPYGHIHKYQTTKSLFKQKTHKNHENNGFMSHTFLSRTRLLLYPLLGERHPPGFIVTDPVSEPRVWAIHWPECLVSVTFRVIDRNDHHIRVIRELTVARHLEISERTGSSARVLRGRLAPGLFW